MSYFKRFYGFFQERLLKPKEIEFLKSALNEFSVLDDSEKTFGAIRFELVFSI